MIQEFTISVFTENKTGLLMRVVSVFTRRHINIESLTTSQSSMEGIFRFTIVVNVTEEQVLKIVAQLDKHVEVLKAFYYHNHDVVYQEIALYKIPLHVYTDNGLLETVMRKHKARVLSIEKEFIVIEKTGTQAETEQLLTELKKTGIYEFVRSGRVAVTKPMEELKAYLKAVERGHIN